MCASEVVVTTHFFLLTTPSLMFGYYALSCEFLCVVRITVFHMLYIFNLWIPLRLSSVIYPIRVDCTCSRNFNFDRRQHLSTQPQLSRLTSWLRWLLLSSIPQFSSVYATKIRITSEHVVIQNKKTVIKLKTFRNSRFIQDCEVEFFQMNLHCITALGDDVGRGRCP